MTLGEFIRKKRLLKDLNQKAVAKLLSKKGKSVSHQYYGRIEKDLEKPSLERLTQLSEILNLDYSVLVTLYAKTFPDSGIQVAFKPEQEKSSRIEARTHSFKMGFDSGFSFLIYREDIQEWNSESMTTNRTSLFSAAQGASEILDFFDKWERKYDREKATWQEREEKLLKIIEKMSGSTFNSSSANHSHNKETISPFIERRQSGENV